MPRRALAYEATTFDSAQANWPDYRLLPGQPPGPVGYAVAWCHGAPGIVRSRLFAEACGGFEVAAEIEAGLGTTARYAEQWCRAPNAGLHRGCHGIFGLADTLLDGVRSGRRACPVLADRLRNRALSSRRTRVALRS